MSYLKKRKLQDQLFALAKVGRVEGVSSVLSQGADINGNDSFFWSVLRAAANFGHADLVSYLIDHGANIDDKSPRAGNTALILAVSRGHEDVVRTLLDLGANVNESNHENMTALHMVAQTGHLQICAILIERGAKINATNNCIRTPLHVATACNSLEIVKHLVTIPGINVNATNSDGHTPLHFTSVYARLEIVEVLLDHGADRDLRDKDSKTAFDLATEKSHQLIAIKIKWYGIESNSDLVQSESAKSTEELDLELNRVKSRLALKEEENQDLSTKIPELETRIKEMEKMFEERKSFDAELVTRLDELKSQGLKDQETMELVAEMKKFETETRRVVDRLTTDQKKRSNEIEVHLKNVSKTRIRIESETNRMKLLCEAQTAKIESLSSQLRGDANRLEGLEKSIENRLSQLEISSKRDDMSENFLNMNGTMVKVKNDVRSLQIVVDDYIHGSAKDLALLKTDLNNLKRKNVETYCTCVETSIDSNESDLDNLVSELEEMLQAINKTQEPMKGAELNNFNSKETKKKSDKDMKLERNEIEQGLLLDTVEIFAVRQTEGENLIMLVQSLSRELGVKADDVKKISRLSRHVIEVQFRNVESARSWLVAFREKPQDILAWNLNRSLGKIKILVSQKLTNYNRDLWNRVKKSANDKFFEYWLRDGKIFLRQKGHKNAIRIKTVRDIPT